MPSFTARFDPTAVLDIHPFADEPWARSLMLGEKQQAVRLFIRALRQGAPRSRREHGMVDIYQTWSGNTIGLYGGHDLQPDKVIRKHYIGCYGKEHTFDGEIDWLFDATENDGENQTAEWQVQLNRHYQWVPLAQKYESTNEAKYAQHWEYELRTWVDQCLPRPLTGNLPCPSAWRTIDTGIRAAWTWPYAFETFRKSPYVSDEAIWLFVVAMHEMGKHLLHWPKARNWKTMESNGLAHVGMMFPELQLSHAFRDTAIDRVVAEAVRQFYPDGVQDELAPSYAIVSISNLYCPIMLRDYFVERFPGPTMAEVPRDTWQRLTDAVEGLALIAAPDSVCPPIHDSPPTMMNRLYETWQPGGGVAFDRTCTPWTESGLFTLPYSGWTMMRRDDRYLMFDTGPWGTAHQHSDAMQVLTHAHGEWFTIDPGKPLYNRSAMTQHIRSSAGHNVVLMDGRPHLPTSIDRLIHEPYELLTHTGDHKVGIFAASANRAFTTIGEDRRGFAHDRTVVDLPGIGWLVIDEMQSDDDGTHHWEALWHLATDVRLDGEIVIATSTNGATMHIATRSVSPDTAIERAVIAGQTTPTHRGWQSVGKGDTPTPCPTACITLSSATGRAALVTLLTTQPGDSQRHVQVTLVEASDVGIRIHLDHEWVSHIHLDRHDCRVGVGNRMTGKVEFTSLRRVQA